MSKNDDERMFPDDVRRMLEELGFTTGPIRTQLLDTLRNAYSEYFMCSSQTRGDHHTALLYAVAKAIPLIRRMG